MRILIYAGFAPSRDQVLAYSAPLVRAVARSVTLVAGGGSAGHDALRDAVTRLDLPVDMSRELLSLEGEPWDVLRHVAGMRNFDLVIFGRFQRPLQRFLLGQRSKFLAQHLPPSVLRVQGRGGSIQRILLASGGDSHTLANTRLIVPLARAIGASVTLLHVRSQQSLIFEGFEREVLEVERSGEQHTLSEVQMLAAAAAIFERAGVNAVIEVRQGSVIETVVDACDDHDLLICGTHESSNLLDRVLLENLTGDLLDMSPIPVLVVRSVNVQEPAVPRVRPESADLP
jgi:nucleotide-binding universal stress UspA family protein